MLKLILALALAVGLAGCIVRGHGGRLYIAPLHPIWTVQVGHVHSAHCGHYYHRNRWYENHGHTHGSGCGHYYRADRWCHAEDD